MDPTEALRLLIAAALEGNSEELREHAGNLADWLEAGGFAPSDPADVSRRAALVLAERSHAANVARLNLLRQDAAQLAAVTSEQLSYRRGLGDGLARAVAVLEGRG